ncbi:8607_t:CDS:2 [Entrophospora sp. SA101]|nr:6619_t:CDS:2 [Entrophospora sp. SA101]CAJ0630396.1 8607_t:CDS:2 [Entrophospora sp. SA101]CAJ0896882.1 12635_t:CDS:2 [Entrophospora sp. SA101]CAJ0896955.1 12642_t:CDS:2 [Entrophospora sp. SA101]CAJ0907554.1 12105_t:CDS:2 [Entrophospora sp. SA101]
MCFSAAKWKREQVQDHKFDFVNIKEFKEESWLRKIRYSFVFLVVIKSVLVYVGDLWTAGILLFLGHWGTSIQPVIPIAVSKWIFLGSILASFLLLILDGVKAKSILISKDISYTFTNTVAYRYYTVKSYSYYCFFSQINNSQKITDRIAFFVFFTFKGWKRLLFAEAPRQVINGFTLFTIFKSNKSRKYFDLDAYESISNVQTFAVFVMMFTVCALIISATMLIFAFLLYIPLLCHIRGNLKEFCCHKIDKRITEILKKKSKKRYQQKQLEASEKKKTMQTDPRPLREPTLPTIEDVPPYGAPPPPMPYSNYLNSPPPMFDDRMSNKSPEPMNPPPYISRPNTPGYHQPPYPQTSAAGQRPPQHIINSNELFDYKAPLPPRSISPSPSISSQGSNPGRSYGNTGSIVPARYQYDNNRTPKYNNYQQQGA